MTSKIRKVDTMTNIAFQTLLGVDLMVFKHTGALHLSRWHEPELTPDSPVAHELHERVVR